MSWGSAAIMPGHRSGKGAAYHPAVASAAPSTGSRDPRPRVGRPDAERPGDRPGRLVAVRLREHDLQLRGRVSGAIGLYLNDRFGARDGGVLLSVSVALSVGHQRARVADPRCASPTVAAGGCRSCSCSPRCASARRSSSPTSPPLVGLALFIVANFAYQAALIYYDATLKTVSYPETRGRLSGHRDGHRLLRDDLRRRC